MMFSVKNSRNILLGLCVLLGACSDASDVTYSDAGEYNVRVTAMQSAGGRLGAKVEAFDIAARYCKENFKNVSSVTKIAYSEPLPWPHRASVEITFLCLEKNNPQIDDIPVIEEGGLISAVEPEEKFDPFAELEPASGEAE